MDLNDFTQERIRADVHRFINENGAFNKIPTFVTKLEQHFLADCALLTRYNLVEVGSWLGASSAILGIIAKNTGRKAYCVDSWQHCDVNGYYLMDCFPKWQQNMVDCGVREWLEPIKGLSPAAADLIVPLSGADPFDFLFLDGDHCTTAVIKDFSAFSRILWPPAIITFHDVLWPSVKEAIGQIRTIENSLGKFEYKTEIPTSGDINIGAMWQFLKGADFGLKLPELRQPFLGINA